MLSFWEEKKKKLRETLKTIPYVLIKPFVFTVIITACVLRWEGVLYNVGPGEMSGSGYWTDDMRYHGLK